MEQIDSQAEVILGVDTHLDVHVGVVIDAVGRVKGTLSIETTPKGYEQLLNWARSFGRLVRAGIEGTGSYGAGLTRFLERSGVAILEINRPNRSRRRNRGKSDPTDAESAARAVLADDATGAPKAQSGLAEALRTLSVARNDCARRQGQQGPRDGAALSTCLNCNLSMAPRPSLRSQRMDQSDAIALPRPPMAGLPTVHEPSFDPVWPALPFGN